MLWIFNGMLNGIPGSLVKGENMLLLKWIVIVSACCAEGQPQKVAAPAQPAPNRICLPVTVYLRPDSAQGNRAREYLVKLAQERPEIQVSYLDVVSDLAARKKYYALVRQHRISKPGVPGIHVGHRFLIGFDKPETTGPYITDSLSFEVFTREGCPHCASAKEFLPGLQQRYPGLKISIRDVIQVQEARDRMQYLAGQAQVQVPNLPMFWIFGKPVVGFVDAATTGVQVEKLVQEATAKCAPADAKSLPPGDGPKAAPSAQKKQSSLRNPNRRRRLARRMQTAMPVSWMLAAAVPPAKEKEEDPIPDEPPPPEEASPGDAANPVQGIPAPETAPEEVTLPFFGKVRVRDFGLPLFTIVLGLVDGFNPCAMWVLIFLLSILVNLKDRFRIALIAGVFVLVSGLAYFAFMAAWLNVFALIRMARTAQIVLGLVALVIGVINVKDFFAFKKGISLSIPESYKPGIYARVRSIVAAKYLTAALAGAMVLAVLVNMVELLCTAGLPAAYTSILHSRQLPWWQDYAYLSLYIACYMLDDTIMVSIAVVTLSHRKMQESQGRWLKLISGSVVLAIGLVMLFKPAWLQYL